MKSKAATVAQYLASLPPERRKVLAAVRSVIKRNLPKGYVEGIDYGMISYAVPLSRLPDTYNGKPLAYVRFRALEDLPLDAIGRTVAKTPLTRYVKRYKDLRSS